MDGRRTRIRAGCLACVLLWLMQPFSALAQAGDQAASGKAGKKSVAPLRESAQPRLTQQKQADTEGTPIPAEPPLRQPEVPQEAVPPLELKGVRG